jgi:hypothetical protein
MNKLIRDGRHRRSSLKREEWTASDSRRLSTALLNVSVPLGDFSRRRLAESPRLDLFRPFPDLEMVEVLARDNVTGRFAGIQVKTATTAHRYHEAHIHVRKVTLSAASSTWLVGLAWREEAGAFDAECLLIPASEIPKVAYDDGTVMVIDFHPASPRRTSLDPYRKPLAELSGLVVEEISITRRAFGA